MFPERAEYSGTHVSANPVNGNRHSGFWNLLDNVQHQHIKRPKAMDLPFYSFGPFVLLFNSPYSPRSYRLKMYYLMSGWILAICFFPLFIGHCFSSLLRCICSIPWAGLLRLGCIVFPSWPLPAGTGGRRGSLYLPRPAGCGRSSATGRRSALPDDGGPGPDG